MPASRSSRTVRSASSATAFAPGLGPGLRCGASARNAPLCLASEEWPRPRRSPVRSGCRTWPFAARSSPPRPREPSGPCPQRRPSSSISPASIGNAPASARSAVVFPTVRADERDGLAVPDLEIEPSRAWSRRSASPGPGRRGDGPVTGRADARASSTARSGRAAAEALGAGAPLPAALRGRQQEDAANIGCSLAPPSRLQVRPGEPEQRDAPRTATPTIPAQRTKRLRGGPPPAA